MDRDQPNNMLADIENEANQVEELGCLAQTIENAMLYSPNDPRDYIKALSVLSRRLSESSKNLLRIAQDCTTKHDGG